MTLRVLVVDDEQLAREELCYQLERLGEIEIAGQAGNGLEALAAIDRLEPDLVFLDVQMPGLGGFEVARRMLDREDAPALVFVTAYDQHAIEAFEVNAVDYLLKPVDPVRLSEALDRALVRHRDRRNGHEELSNAIHELRQSIRAPRLPVKEGGRIRFVNVSDVDFMIAEGNYVRLRIGKESYLIRETLSGLEERYTSLGFLRIHRALLVQTEKIVEISPLFHGAYSVRLRDGSKLVSGRTYRERIRQALLIED